MYLPLLILIFLVLFLFTSISQVKTPALGNYLQGYFYYRLSAHATQQDPNVYMRMHKGRAKTNELNRFYAKLSWRREPNQVNFLSDWDTTWQAYDGREIRDNYLNYWQRVRQVAKQEYDASLPKVEINIPVIHFRCSDAPFIKHSMYHLTKKTSVEWMAAQVKGRGYTKAILLNCSKNHYSLDKDSCSKYVDFYKEIFTAAGVEIIVQCGSQLQDFSAMYNSPLLVSLNQSTFSFMAGIAKDPSDYISCNIGYEGSDGYMLMSREQADWVLDQQVPLLHAQVADYNDPNSVIQQLLN